MTPRVAALLIVLCLVTCAVSLAHAAGEPPDPLEAMLRRIDAYLHREETEGVTLDSRELHNPPEATRLSIVPQLLAYCELYRVHPNAALSADIVSRADFLVDRLDAVTSKTAADGMLGYALLSAYEATGDPRYRTAAAGIVQQSLALGGFGLKLNWGLMAALALAKHDQLEGDPSALAQARRIVWGVACDQNADGSLPHVCRGSKDVHYTAWITMELILLDRMLHDPLISRMLVGTLSFLQARVGADGTVSYQDLMGLTPVAYFGPANGCRDYDTRAWVNELGYEALLFDHFDDPRYRAVMGRMLALEDHGSFPDKWGSMPSPDDPLYAWASAPRSVIRTSVIFWSLAATYADREQRGRGRGLESRVAAVQEPTPAGEAGWPIDGLGSFPFTPAGFFMGEAVPDQIPATAESLATPGVLAAESRPADMTGTSAAPRGGPGTSTHPQPSTDPVQGASLMWVQSSAGGMGEIRFSLSGAGQASLRVFDVVGRSVRELWRGGLEAGMHRVEWDGRDDAGRLAPAGVYVVRLATAEGVRSARFARLR